MLLLSAPAVVLAGKWQLTLLFVAAAAVACLLLSQATCLLSTCTLHELLTGVAFCGESCDDVAAVAYDSEALLIWKASKA